MLFQALADIVGYPVDQVTPSTMLASCKILSHVYSCNLCNYYFAVQVRYVILLFVSYPLAYVFRYALHPSHTSLITRHIFSLSFGLLYGFLCFTHSQMIVLFAIIGVCYAMLQYLPATVVQR